MGSKLDLIHDADAAMIAARRIKFQLVVTIAAIIALLPAAAPAQAGPGTAKAAPQTAEERNGLHDFDFLFGTWKVHNRGLLHPLSGAKEEWAESDGTSVVRPIWGGRANTEEYDAETPSGHADGLTVQTYNPHSHQWSIYWTNSKNGAFSIPSTVGKFKDGRGEFFDQEDYEGQTIFVRYLWTVPSVDAPRWEQAFSVDGGKTWETNRIITYTRIKN
jgi:hypothetical protein